MHKIVICGPESTGKTTLCRELAEHYQTTWVPEFAREYIGRLNRKYTYDDVEIIAKKQIQQWESISHDENNLVFFDTGLIITKVWFSEVYNKVPFWLENELTNYKPDMYLLCYYDIEWEFDTIRENGNDEQRAYLFAKYLEEIKKQAVNIK
jgi:NadR type nicotinamide-nucleotide adenylyltransferase